jgi:hypothetical protein
MSVPEVRKGADYSQGPGIQNGSKLRHSKYQGIYMERDTEIWGGH